MERKKSYTAALILLCVMLASIVSFGFIITPKVSAEEQARKPEAEVNTLSSANGAVYFSSAEIAHDDKLAGENEWFLGAVLHINPQLLDYHKTDQIIISWNPKYFASIPAGFYGYMIYTGEFIGSTVSESFEYIIGESEQKDSTQYVKINVDVPKNKIFDGWKWSEVVDITCTIILQVQLKEGEQALSGDMLYINYQHNSVVTSISGISFASNGMINGISFTNSTEKNFIAAAALNLNP